jgi:hypothetical protein
MSDDTSEQKIAKNRTKKNKEKFQNSKLFDFFPFFNITKQKKTFENFESNLFAVVENNV